MSSGPYLSHLLDRLTGDLEFLSAQQLLSTADLQLIRAKLDAIPRGQAADPSSSVVNGMQALQLQQPQSHNANGVPNSSGGQCKAIWAYQKSQPDDLSFQPGDIIEIVEEVNADWWKGSLNGQTGLFPANHVERIQEGHAARAPPPPPPSAHPQNGSPYSVGYPHSHSGSTFTPPPPPSHYGAPPPHQPQYAYQQPQYYAQNPGEKQPYQPYTPVPGPVVSSAPPVTEEEKKKKFPGGKFGKQMGTAVAGGMGFGIGSAVTSNAINAIF
ncbi:SH3 domain-containing protein [Sporobolomyces koalae]|uniref:SH3 domain-containing protein n=1 Tax=Sporobolomyces koalae TaxID=500713 RepID=UPI0031828371